MAAIISSNYVTQLDLTFLVNFLNVGQWIGLYQNAITPTADTLFGDFIPCTFPGYSPQALTSKFPVPLKVSSGIYQSSPRSFTWTPTADSPQLAIGFYLFGAGQWLYAQRFGVPLPINNGSVITVNFAIQNLAQQVACV